jgi:hypothetical protein
MTEHISVIPESAEADVRNPEKTAIRWIPDLSFASSGMTVLSFSGFFKFAIRNSKSEIRNFLSA